MFGEGPIAPFDKTVVNVVSGMKERVFYLDDKGTPKPTCVRKAGELAGLCRMVSSYIGVSDRATSSEFLESRTGFKKKIYVAARERLNVDHPTLAELAELGYFVKQESTLWVKVQVPRIISPRSPSFNYLLGKYLLPIEKQVYAGLAHIWGSDVVVAKGLTMEEKGETIARKLRPGWVCVGLDASRFDQTIGAELLKAEHSVYTGCYPGDRLLPALLKCQLDNKGKATCLDGSVKARIGAMRCSGDQNTSLGNCLISCLLAKLFALEKGLVDVDCFNDGDDLLLFLPATALPLLADLQEWYLNWGLRMKVEEPAYVPERVEFCQARPVWTPRGYVLVRNPSKALNTDFSGNALLGRNDYYLNYLRAVGVCGMSLAAGIPIFQAIYSWAIRNGRTGKVNLNRSGALSYQSKIQQRAGHLARWLDVHPSTRLSFELAFGINPVDQIAMEGAVADMHLGRLSTQSYDIHNYFTHLPNCYWLSVE